MKTRAFHAEFESINSLLFTSWQTPEKNRFENFQSYEFWLNYVQIDKYFYAKLYYDDYNKYDWMRLKN